MDGGKPIKESRDVDVPLAAAHFFYHAGWADKLAYAFPGASRGRSASSRPDHPVELPAPHGGVEDRAGARVRQHGRPQARRDDAADGARCSPRSSRRPSCRPASSTSSPGAGETGARARQPPGASTRSPSPARPTSASGSSARVAGTGSGSRSSSAARPRTSSSPTRALDQAVEGIVNGIYFNQGHVCCAGSRLLVEESVPRRVVRKLARRIATLRLGDPLDKNTDVGAINSKAQLAQDPRARAGRRRRGRRRSTVAVRAAASGLLVPADVLHRRRASRTASRARRSSARCSGDDVPHARRGDREGEQHAVRPLGRRLDRQGREDLPHRDEAARRRRLGQHVQQVRPGSPFGGYKETGFGTRGRHGRGCAEYVDDRAVNGAAGASRCGRRTRCTSAARSCAPSRGACCRSPPADGSAPSRTSRGARARTCATPCARRAPPQPGLGAAHRLQPRPDPLPPGRGARGAHRRARRAASRRRAASAAAPRAREVETGRRVRRSTTPAGPTSSHAVLGARRTRSRRRTSRSRVPSRPASSRSSPATSRACSALVDADRRRRSPAATRSSRSSPSAIRSAPLDLGGGALATSRRAGRRREPPLRPARRGGAGPRGPRRRRRARRRLRRRGARLGARAWPAPANVTRYRRVDPATFAVDVDPALHGLVAAQRTRRDEDGVASGGHLVHDAPWDVRATRVLHDTVVRVEEQDVVTPDGRSFAYLLVRSRGFVKVVPVTTAGEIVFVHQYRHAFARTTLELPAGGIDPGRSPRPPRAASSPRRRSCAPARWSASARSRPVPAGRTRSARSSSRATACADPSAVQHEPTAAGARADRRRVRADRRRGAGCHERRRAPARPRPAVESTHGVSLGLLGRVRAWHASRSRR